LFVEIVDKFKFGFRVYDKKEYAAGIFNFIIWDVLVALSVLFHQHGLVFIGLWKKRECDIETIHDAKRRIQVYIDKIKEERALKQLQEEEEAKQEVRELRKIKKSIKITKDHSSILPKLEARLHKDDSERLQPRRTLSDTELQQQEDDSESDIDMNHVVYGPNYFIHEYSSDTEKEE
jgi:hypothetical protein